MGGWVGGWVKAANPRLATEFALLGAKLGMQTESRQ